MEQKYNLNLTARAETIRCRRYEANVNARYELFDTEKKKDIEDSGISVLLSWAFDTRMYTFGDNSTTYLDDYGHPLKPNKGCLTSVVVLLSMIFAFSMIGIAVLT